MKPQLSLLPQMLHPAYRDWVKRPGEMYGFWLWTGPDPVRDQIEHTGASATSFHTPMWLEEDPNAEFGGHPIPADRHLPGICGLMSNLGIQAGIGIGEHNNACFVRYPDWFWRKNPGSAMRDVKGKVIKMGDRPWPAMNDPVLTALAREQMKSMVDLLRHESWGRYWVLGGEQGYPDYFGLDAGDFRPVARRQYLAWQALHGFPKETNFGAPEWREWRESAVVDHFAGYTAYIHGLDSTRPVLIPTHGNPFALDLRWKMGYPISELAGAADGFEAGPIAIDDDAERLIRMTLDSQTSFGIPVAAPRLADKRLDPNAKGGGRSFTPASLRRFLYEALGLGVWHLGMVQWSGTLADGEWGISGTPAEAECKEVFNELRAAGPWLDNCSRLQPQVGIYISEAAWRQRWQDRWTLVYDEAIKRGWSVMLVSDSLIGPELAHATPVLISVDNSILARDTRERLSAYTKAGGKVFRIGSTAVRDEFGKPTKPLTIMRTLADDAPGPNVRIIHQTQTVQGANTWTADVKPLSMDALEAAVSQFAEIRPVTVIENGERAEGIEPLYLTDGTNIVVALINRAAQPREVELKPSANIGKRLGKWTIRDIITGKALPSARVHLDASGAALIAIEPMVTPRECEEEIAESNQVIHNWTALKVDLAYLNELRERQREHARAGRTAKALAVSRIINSGIALKPDTCWDGNMLHLQVKAWIADGHPAVGAQVRMRFVPGPFEWRNIPETSAGVFAIRLPKSALPVFYNPRTEKYETPEGAMQIILDAVKGNARGGVRRVLDQTN